MGERGGFDANRVYRAADPRRARLGLFFGLTALFAAGCPRGALSGDAGLDFSDEGPSVAGDGGGEGGPAGMGGTGGPGGEGANGVGAGTTPGANDAGPGGDGPLGPGGRGTGAQAGNADCGGSDASCTSATPISGDFVWGKSVTGTPVSGSGSAWFSATVAGPGIIFTAVTGGVVAELDSPPGANYDLYVHGGGNAFGGFGATACDGPHGSSSKGAGMTDSVAHNWSNTTAADPPDVSIEVRFVDGDCSAEWTLRVRSK